MSTVPVNLPDNRATEGQSAESQTTPDGQPQKTAAQIEAKLEWWVTRRNAAR